MKIKCFFLFFIIMALLLTTSCNVQESDDLKNGEIKKSQSFIQKSRQINNIQRNQLIQLWNNISKYLVQDDSSRFVDVHLMSQDRYDEGIINYISQPAVSIILLIKLKFDNVLPAKITNLVNFIKSNRFIIIDQSPEAVKKEMSDNGSLMKYCNKLENTLKTSHFNEKGLSGISYALSHHICMSWSGYWVLCNHPAL